MGSLSDAAVRSAISGQYHAAMAMLGEAVRLCPEHVWTGGTPPRQFWRLAYHTVYFTHMYLQGDFEHFEKWPKHRDEVESDEQHEKLDATPYTKEEILEYWQIVVDRIDTYVESVDLASQETGIPWYKMPRLDHVLLNLRHVQEHAGQLRDRVMEAGGDASWVSSGREPRGGWKT